MYKLKKDAFMGVLWHSGNYILQQFVLLLVKLVLVRLLIPEEFGIAAMAFIVVSSLQIINAFGTGLAFVRDNESDPVKAKNTLFYLDAAALLIISIIGFFSAPFAASFFGKNISDPSSVTALLWMFRVVALGQVFYIATVVPSRVLSKELRFKESVIAASLGTLAYGIVAVILAFYNFGAWSIIIGQIANIIVSRIVVFAYSPFIPSFVFDWKIAKYYINFGKNEFINSIISVIITNGDDTLIGRVLGSAALGFYSLGQHFAGLVISIVAGVIGKVAFPVFSKLQKDREAYTRAFFKIYRLKNLFAIPSIGGAVILAGEIVALIFGQNWLPILPVFYILSLASFFNHLVTLATPVLNSLNKPKLLRNNKLIQFAFYVVLIYPFTKFWGLIGVGMVMVIFSLVSVVYLAPKLAKEIPNFYSYSFKILSKSLFATFVMMVIVYFIKINVKVGFFWLFGLVLIGAAVYFIIMWFLDKENLRWDIREMLSVVKEKFAFLGRKKQ